MLLLIKKLRNSGVDVNNPDIRRKYGTLSGGMGISLNIILFAIKLTAALLSGSVAVFADAFNNLGDAGSSVVTMVGFRLAGKNPDPQHPFGHGRFEYITGFIVSIAIILMGFELALSSIRSLSTPDVAVFSTLTVVVLCISVLVKLYMAFYNLQLAKVLKSSAIRAVAMDSISDSIATSVVILTLIISHFTNLSLDSYAGILVSAFILYSGISSAKETLQPLLGMPPSPEFVDSVKRIVMEKPLIQGMHDLVVHDYGPGRVMLSLHAELPADIDVFKAHCIIDDLENELNAALGCEAVIHYDPIDTNDVELQRLKAIVMDVVLAINDKISLHDFRYVPGETHTNLLFDIVVPFDMIRCDNDIKKEISAKVLELLPNHYCVIKCDKAMIM